MGELIPFDLGRKVVKKEQPVSPMTPLGEFSSKQVEGELKGERIYYYRDRFEKSVLRYNEKLMNLSVALDSFRKSREIVKNYTNDQLINWPEESNEKDWVSKPAFFGLFI